MRRTLRVIPLAAVAALAAVSACSRDEPSAVSARYHGRTELPASAVVLRVDAARHVRTFRGADLVAAGALDLGTPEYDTPTSGRLEVSYVLGPATAEASRGAVTLDLREDWRWGVTVSVDSANPTRYCFGCMGAKSFPLAAASRRSAKDSVWMVWGGNSIRHPVIY